jgi:3'-phosphoadenosine 5'-phosphosulfate sulfotransferase (PAPS reductase)/FAD synthetase
MSGGKDSTALALLAIESKAENLHFVFSDTGHEHEQTYAYIDYLEKKLEIVIHRVKADFVDRIASKRQMIAEDQRVGRKYKTVPVFDADGNPVPKRNGRGEIITKPNGDPIQKKKKVGGGVRVRWSNKAKRRALSILYPSGIPFLDLCMWKGRFASTKARFCSTELKHAPLDAYAQKLLEGNRALISWQGVRADESLARKNLPMHDVELGCWEPEPQGMLIYRPIINWTVSDVFAIHKRHGIEPNPLYKQGMGRVGCMPCIHARKDELRQIAMRFPEEIDRVREWERLVALASKTGKSSLFTTTISRGDGIDQCVDWSKTVRGGRSYDLIHIIEQEEHDESPQCSSLYGLC